MVTINDNIGKENTEHCSTCLEFQQTQPKAKIMAHEIPVKPWETTGPDIFMLKNKNHLCIVNYHSKFPIVN